MNQRTREPTDPAGPRGRSSPGGTSGVGALLASALWGVVAIGWMIRSGGAAERLEERTRLAAELENLVELRLWDSAWAVARGAGSELWEDSTQGPLVRSFSRVTPIRTDPPGAAVYTNTYGADGAWDLVGTTPLDSARIPRGVTRLRLDLDGHTPLEFGTFALAPDGLDLPSRSHERRIRRTWSGCRGAST